MQKTLTVAIVGTPNAGKSTLLNLLCGQKISIVTPKSQTTRSIVAGVITEGDTQVVFHDTPGIFNAKEKFEAAMVAAAYEALSSCDLVVYMFDSSRKFYDLETSIISKLKRSDQKVYLVLNKIDLVKKERLLGFAKELNDIFLFDRTFMVSAVTGEGIPELKADMISLASPSPWLFPEDQPTNLSERQIAEEITREKLFLSLREELPYGLMVETEKWEEKDGTVEIHHLVRVERDGHKKIIIGRAGESLKQTGTNARREIQLMLGKPTRLFIHVKVDEKWKDKALGQGF